MTCPHNYNYDTCLACVLWELEMQKSIRDWTRNFIMAETLSAGKYGPESTSTKSSHRLRLRTKAVKK